MISLFSYIAGMDSGGLTKLSFGHNQELIVVRVEIPTLRQRGDKEYRVHVMLFEADELVAEQESIEVLDAWCK